jgi:hypothetical protein
MTKQERIETIKKMSKLCDSQVARIAAGHDKIEVQAIALIIKAMRKGDVSAAVALLGMLESEK